jgi:hypothetical protein
VQRGDDPAERNIGQRALTGRYTLPDGYEHGIQINRKPDSGEEKVISPTFQHEPFAHKRGEGGGGLWRK